ncbi:MAG TPA: hypothetical protein PLI80_08305, partial [Ottowia sp.]|nr:hypothetical protein [Ottowia sp.]
LLAAGGERSGGDQGGQQEGFVHVKVPRSRKELPDGAKTPASVPAPCCTEGEAQNTASTQALIIWGMSINGDKP